MFNTVKSITRFVALTAIAASIAGCEAKKSANPLSPTVAGPIAGVSIDAPVPVSPVNGAEVVNTQPLRLTFNNGQTNGVRPLYYQVELGSDANFSSTLFANSKVQPGENGRTSVVVDGTLAAERTYFWRVKAADGANESTFSAAARFDLVIPVVIEAPTPVSPAGGQAVSSNTPTLTVNNGRVAGRTGEVRYTFFVSRNTSFTDVVAEIGTVRSGGNQTSVQTAALPMNTLLFWRVVATNDALRDTSTTQSFRTPGAPAPPPPPPGGGGGNPSEPVNWTTEQWRAYVFGLIAQKNLGPVVTLHALGAMRPDLVARGADVQNGWRGDYRPRIFLPVPGCPPPSSPSAPGCAYERAVDLGDWNRPWEWIVRF